MNYPFSDAGQQFTFACRRTADRLNISRLDGHLSEEPEYGIKFAEINGSAIGSEHQIRDISAWKMHERANSESSLNAPNVGLNSNFIIS